MGVRRHAAIALVLIGGAACGSARGTANAGSAPQPATFDAKAPYRFTTRDGLVVENDAGPHRFQTDGVAAPATGIASQTGRDLSGRQPAGSNLYARNTDYESVASWLRQNLPPNVVQRRMLAGKHWVALGPADGPGGRRFSLDALVDDSPFTASFDVLAGLRAAHFAIHSTGTGTVRGVATTRYRATGDAHSYNVNGTTNKAPAVIELWIDHTGRVRRIHRVVHFPSDGDSPPSVDDTITEYYDIGAPVHLVAPRADDVVNGRKLSQAFMCQPLPTQPPKTTPACR